tara:strand:+ start:430 stop:639 length:210 start_codon:yes stop_codon:yes gene_type:complete
MKIFLNTSNINKPTIEITETPTFPTSIWIAGKELEIKEVINETDTPNWADLFGKDPVFKHAGKLHAYYS